MKATVTSVLKTRVERLTNNVIFLIRGDVDASPGKSRHHRIHSIVGKSMLL